ncbi:MAG: hypothetical protein HY909_14455 [Deltaproteobacteria bacterium]|nr:hypothetical protein [Deltaproteobacteria bacterium]
MSDVESLTLAVLREIRDKIQGTNERLDQTRTELLARIDQTNERLDRTNERLDRTNERLDRTIQEQIRQATVLVDVRRDMERMANAMVAFNDRFDNLLLGSLGTTVRDHTRRLDDLEERVEVMETQRR